MVPTKCLIDGHLAEILNGMMVKINEQLEVVVKNFTILCAGKVTFTNSTRDNIQVLQKPQDGQIIRKV